MPIKNYYTLKDIRDLTCCTHRQLQYWEQKAYIAPKLGSRNVRYYRKEDLTIIQQLMDAKKNGKTLGEAWGDNVLSITTKNPLLLSLDVPTINKISQLSAEWLAINNQFLEQIAATGEMEKNTPGYPFSLYQRENLEKLQKNAEIIKKIIKKRASLEDSLRKLLKDLSPGTTVELTQEECGINTIDALILFWAKCKNGDYSKPELLQIRESFAERLLRGESYQDIVTAIKLLNG